MKVILVTGTRRANPHTADYGFVTDKLIASDPDLVIHGDARGVDAIARDWCEHGGTTHIPMPADWKNPPRYMAGPRRNSDMVSMAITLKRYGHEVIVYAFPDNESRGTIDCMNKAYKAGLEVREYPFA